ncbi:SufD family Fe-S cluster assembly protein [Methanopyrus sp. KOL6]|uniref:SufB/SufD family protein n=1 Tax=Methanopyrus sp. KOL6 TaxID=1937004 RepID=UPI000B4B0B3B|nr:SufD family Fe-S cluster assembly protein [Methanopyrus sp. KOL6]
MRGGVSPKEVFKPTGYHAGPDTPRIVIIENKVVNVQGAEGLELNAEEEDDTVVAELVVKEGYEFDEPIHMCVGVPWPEGVQRIVTRLIVEPEAKIRLMSHCSFPRARDVVHEMEAEFEIGECADVKVTDVHYHGEGGVRLKAEYDVSVGPEASFTTEFKLTEGRVGELEWGMDAHVEERATVEGVARLRAVEEDHVRAVESVRLIGEDARTLLDFKAAAIDGAFIELVGEISGEADGARGHVECSEIIKGGGKVVSVPKLRVVHPGARLTHEAALGTVEKKEVETLMSRGLSEEEAVELLVNAMLRG